MSVGCSAGPVFLRKRTMDGRTMRCDINSSYHLAVTFEIVKRFWLLVCLIWAAFVYLVRATFTCFRAVVASQLRRRR